MNTSLGLKVSIIALLAICVVLGFVVIKNGLLSRQNNRSFDPKDYGIPSQIGGYEVMAVVPSESLVCSKPGMMNLILRAIPNQQVTLTENDLHKIGESVHAEVYITVTSGGVTIESTRNQVDSWNRNMRPGDCLPIGMHLQTLIPPTQLTSLP